MKINNIRREYQNAELRSRDLQANPFRQFELWLEVSLDAGISDPTAMVLATVSAEGVPSQRIVLLKEVSADGFVFYTNYQSAKACDIENNPTVSLLFPWHAINRQIMVCGVVERVSEADSATYFHSRPRESQLAAWASPQSEVLDSRHTLQQCYEGMQRRFSGVIPLPENWGGYIVKPITFEFWQGGKKRLHDRFIYKRRQKMGSWDIFRLAP